MRGWQMMDRQIQRRIDEAKATGDPKKIQEAYDDANISYAEGTGAIICATIGTLVFPVVGTIVGGVIGHFLGAKVVKK